ncbi:tRNA pseudouridine(38-40) synthase TruA [Halorubrum gandharaense]
MRAFRVAYDGRAFAGFQRQPHARTVEGTLLRALASHDLLDHGEGPTHETPPGYAAAGRTDAGVSAVSQTVAFEAPDWLTPRAFNGHLPATVRVWAAADVPEGFHATHDATRRTYRYHLFAPPGGDGVPEPGAPDAAPPPVVDDDRFRAALVRLAGTHDYANLSPDDTGTERTVAASVTREGDFLVVEVTADGFPREFVRRFVTAARRVGTGAADLAFLDRLLDPEPVSGGLAVGPAPATPLVLWDVSYDGVPFDVDPAAAESARAAFAERHRDARHAAAATAALRDRVGGELGSQGADAPTENGR